MSERADEESLLAIAGSISDRMSLDWNDVRRMVADAEQATVIDELQLLEGIASVHADDASWGSLTLLESIGRGSFATVYRAFDADLQRDVAVKITGVRQSTQFDPALRSAGRTPR